MVTPSACTVRLVFSSVSSAVEVIASPWLLCAPILAERNAALPKLALLRLRKQCYTPGYSKGGFAVDVDLSNFPKCQKCKSGDLVPLSDFGSQGAPIHYKAWVCTNPDCGFNLKIRNGDVYMNEPVMAANSH